MNNFTSAEDVANYAVIADYVDYVQLTRTMATPTEVPGPMQDLVAICTCLRNTEKHVEWEALDARSQGVDTAAATRICGDSDAACSPRYFRIKLPPILKPTNAIVRYARVRRIWSSTWATSSMEPAW